VYRTIDEAFLTINCVKKSIIGIVYSHVILTYPITITIITHSHGSVRVLYGRRSKSMEKGKLIPCHP